MCNDKTHSKLLVINENNLDHIEIVLFSQKKLKFVL